MQNKMQRCIKSRLPKSKVSMATANDATNNLTAILMSWLFPFFFFSFTNVCHQAQIYSAIFARFRRRPSPQDDDTIQTSSGPDIV